MLPDIIRSRPGFLADFDRTMNRFMKDFMDEGPFVPRLDFHDERDKLIVSAELPGIAEKDVEIQLDDDLLTIKGEKKCERDHKTQGSFMSECNYGAFERSVRLPNGIDATKVQAKFDKGILTIEIPRKAEARKEVKKIPIRH